MNPPIDFPEEGCGCTHNTVDYKEGQVVERYCDKPGKCKYKRGAE